MIRASVDVQVVEGPLDRGNRTWDLGPEATLVLIGPYEEVLAIASELRENGLVRLVDIVQVPVES